MESSIQSALAKYSWAAYSHTKRYKLGYEAEILCHIVVPRKVPKKTTSAAQPAAPAAKAAKAATSLRTKTRLKAKGLAIPVPKRVPPIPSVAGKNQSGPRPRTSNNKMAAGPDDPKYTELTPIVLTAMLAALAQCGRITKVCHDLRIHYPTVHALKEEDKEFKERFDEAMKQAFVGMEDEVRRRAFNGVAKPVYQGGVLVGHIQEYSDTLAQFMIRAGKPEVYSPKIDAAVQHSGNVAVAHSYAQLSDEALNAEINKKLRFLGLIKPTADESDVDAQDADPLKDSPEEAA